MIDVNLLPEQKASSIREEKLKKFATAGVVCFSAIWLLGLFGVYGYSLFLEREEEALVIRQENAKNRLRELSNVSGNILALHQKVSGIGYINKSRFDFKKSLKYVQSIFPPEVVAEKLSINAEGEVAIHGKSTNPLVASAFISKMGNESTLKYPIMTTFRYLDDGSFSFDISAQYGDKTQKSNN